MCRIIYLLQYLSFIDLQQGGSLSLGLLFLPLEAAECILKGSRIFISKLWTCWREISFETSRWEIVFSIQNFLCTCTMANSRRITENIWICEMKGYTYILMTKNAWQSSFFSERNLENFFAGKAQNLDIWMAFPCNEHVYSYFLSWLWKAKWTIIHGCHFSLFLKFNHILNLCILIGSLSCTMISATLSILVLSFIIHRAKVSILLAGIISLLSSSSTKSRTLSPNSCKASTLW